MYINIWSEIVESMIKMITCARNETKSIDKELRLTSLYFFLNILMLSAHAFSATVLTPA